MALMFKSSSHKVVAKQGMFFIAWTSGYGLWHGNSKQPYKSLAKANAEAKRLSLQSARADSAQRSGVGLKSI